MRWAYFFALQLLLALVIAGIIYKHKDKVTIIKTPPKALAQWYKPENKRQVWLHNMFKLRREMQAVEFYAEKQDDKHLVEWSQALNQHYPKIADMVPSWSNKLDLSTLSHLQSAANSQNYQGVLTAVKKLQENCDSCHSDYQAITALMYRSADFSAIEVEPSQPFNSHMQMLSQQVNQIKIAFKDEMPELALSTLDDLNKGMIQLGNVCSDCHAKENKPYPNQAMKKTLSSLEASLKTGTLKEQGMALGTLAVQACANCHGTHKLAFSAKTLLSKEPSLAELLKH
ncbi:multiheme c-type cytochrome [Colwelliaceae bacterium 6441]